MLSKARIGAFIVATFLAIFAGRAYSGKIDRAVSIFPQRNIENERQPDFGEFVNEPWYFVHITDPHCLSGEEQKDNWSESPSLSRWYSAVAQIASFQPQPEFVLCTGDLVEFGAGGVAAEMNYVGLLACLYGDTDAQEYYVDEGMSVPIYFCPGNHDAHTFFLVSSSFDNYHRMVKDVNYYKAVGNHYAIFSLNSGLDVFNDGHLALSEGNGLYREDLQRLISDLAVLDEDCLKIVMMHHPYINPEGDFIGSPWNNWVDGVFLNYRDEFIQSCEEYAVDLVLFGHVHEGGDDGSFIYGGIWNKEGEQWEENDGTRFVVTNAIKSSNAYRKIYVLGSGDLDIGAVEHFAGSGSIEPASQFEFSQNYPNPFNSYTKISFGIHSASYVRLEIYNVLGQKVGILVDGHCEAGEYMARWNGSGPNGDPIAAGVYFCRLTVDGSSKTKKMLLLK